MYLPKNPEYISLTQVLAVQRQQYICSGCSAELTDRCDLYIMPWGIIQCGDCIWKYNDSREDRERYQWFGEHRTC